MGEQPAEAGLFQAMVNVGLAVDGVVAKHRDSVYTPGVRKIKREGWQEGRRWKG